MKTPLTKDVEVATDLYYVNVVEVGAGSREAGSWELRTAELERLTYLLRHLLSVLALPGGDGGRAAVDRAALRRGGDVAGDGDRRRGDAGRCGGARGGPVALRRVAPQLLRARSGHAGAVGSAAAARRRGPVPLRAEPDDLRASSSSSPGPRSCSGRCRTRCGPRHSWRSTRSTSRCPRNRCSSSGSERTIAGIADMCDDSCRG